jgi:hypothetical protein
MLRQPASRLLRALVRLNSTVASSSATAELRCPRLAATARHLVSNSASKCCTASNAHVPSRRHFTTALPLQGLAAIVKLDMFMKLSADEIEQANSQNLCTRR